MEIKRQTYIFPSFTNNMKKESLKYLGLTDKEVSVYLSNLQLGSSLVQEIANFANLNRTSTYDLLKSLEQKGFVSHIIQSRKRFYQAIRPKDLMRIFKEKEKSIKKIIPELESIYETVGKKPNIEVYVGKKSIKTIFENILENTKSFSCIASKTQLIEIFQFYIPNFVKRRIKKGIKVRLITESEPIDKKAKYKLLKRKINTATWIYDGKIAMISLEENKPIAILIDEKNFFETHQMMFDLLWDNL